MTTTGLLVLVLLVVCAAGAALAAGFWLAGRRTRRAPTPSLADLLDASRALLEQERAAGAAVLDQRQQHIDHRLGEMTTELGRVRDLVTGLERDRRQAFGQLSNELRRQHEGLSSLHETTVQLREALANSRARGQWGERMAEDVLRLAGFLEGVNYTKQATLEMGGRPDYTFLLPGGLVLHMDVKFPLDNYLRFLEAATDAERARLRDRFLRDVRDRVKELGARSYLDAPGESVDCLLLFIPNETVYAFVNEHDAGVLDEALRRKIVICSPLTLYAVLAVVRQAVDNFRLEQASDEILRLLGDFTRQWERYTEQLDAVKRRFDGVAKEYEALLTTRQRALQRPLDKIDTLRRDRLDLVEGEEAPLALDA